MVVDGLLGTASRVAWGLDLAVDMPMSVGAAMGPVRSNGSAIPGGGSAAASAVHAGSGVSSHAGAHSASMGTMSMTVGSHATNILPSWLAVGWTLVFLAIVLSLIPHDMQYGPQAALIAEAFTPRLRYSGASIGYQLASIIAGGPAPLIATALFAAYSSGYAVAIYIAACAIVSLVSTWMMPDYTGKDISAEYDAAD